MVILQSAYMDNTILEYLVDITLPITLVLPELENKVCEK